MRRSTESTACGVRRLALAGVAGLVLSASPAFAALGGDAESVAADAAAWHATTTQSIVDGYTDNRLVLPRGLVVHEFVNGAGRVFEVTWSGKGGRPDMSRLLGAYADRWVESGTSASAASSASASASASARRGPGPIARHAERADADFALHSAVHNRYFTGSAHVPSQLPAALHVPLPVPDNLAR